MKTASIYDFLKATGPILDVRSPAEYSAGHISGAISFPLFTDSERAEVGTLYKQTSRKEAMKRGFDLVGPKMKALIDKAESLDSNDFRIHCWRGGMRSSSVAWLLETYGFKTRVLEGGYKSFRKAIVELFNSDLKLIVLSGYTGTKKTEILLKMKELGQQVIDLEGLARHQGSSFGNIMSYSQPSTEQFHNLLFESARHFDKSRPIWMEDESFNIGRCALPQALYELKEKSPHIVIDIPLSERLDYLVADYGQAEKALLIKATEGIRKRLGHQRADEAINSIKAGDMKSAAEIILHYYDKNYLHARKQKKADIVAVEFKNKSIEEMASALIEMTLIKSK